MDYKRVHYDLTLYPVIHILNHGEDLLCSFIDGLLQWDYVTLSYNNKTGETSHVFSMTQHYDFEDLFIMKKGFNIDVTQGQYMMLYNIMCEHNQMVNPQANPDFDLQTFDNLFQAITMAKETYLK